MKKTIFFIIFSIFQTFTSVSAQNDSLKLDREHWQNISKDIDYGDAHFEEEDAETQDLTNNEEGSSDFNLNVDAEIWRPVSFTLLIILAIIVIVMLLKKSRTPVNVKRKRIEAESIDDAEENLPDVALDNIYDEAIEKGDYRSALRIKFLMVLQKLLDNKHIIWKRQKTNEQYIREIKDENLQIKFTELVQTFDNAWYGTMHISENIFNRMNETVTSINLLLNEQQQ